MVKRKTQRARTREAIINAATTLIAEHGYDTVTMTDIATEAQVSRPTVFRHFPTKADVVLDRLDRWLAAGPEAISIAEDLPSALRRYAGRIARAIAGDRHARDLLALIAGDQDLLRAAAARRRQWSASFGALALERGYTSLDAAVIGDTAVSALQAAIVHWSTSRRRTPLEPLLERAFDLVSAGLDTARPGTGDPKSRPGIPSGAAPLAKS